MKNARLALMLSALFAGAGGHFVSALSATETTAVELDNGTTVGVAERVAVNVNPKRDLHGPCVIRAANGDLLLSHQDSNEHGGGDGFARQWRSTDNGFTWENEGPVADWRSRKIDSLFGEYGLAPDGRLVMIVQRRKVLGGDRGIVGSWLQTSTDHGRTWKEIGPVDGSHEDAVMFGRNIIRRDGVMYVGVWSRLGNSLYISEDKGLTWKKRSVIFPTDYPNFANLKNAGPPFYPHVIFCPDGSLLAMTYHTPPKNHCYSRRSHDNGKTWGPIIKERGLRLWAARMKRMDEDTLIVTGRDIRERATVAWFSTDNGESWGHKLILDKPKFPGSYAYTDSIAAGDGKFWVFTSSPQSAGKGDIVGVLLDVTRVVSWVDQRLTHGPFIGHATPTSVLVWASSAEPGEYNLVARAAGNGQPVTAKARSTPERDGCVQWRLDGLRPGTRYHYQIEFDGKKLVHGGDFSFATEGTERSAAVRLAFGSCAREDEGSSAVWRQMSAVDPHAVVLLGDTPYIDSTDLAVQRRRYAEFAAVPDFQRLLRNRSLYATWDDHDFGRNDTDGNVKGKENSRRAFAEYHANASYGDGRAGIYTKFRRGGVEVFLLDTRFFAATEPSPFDEDRPSLLGKQQWQWLRRELKASIAPFKVLACGMIWNGAVRPGKRDHWATYPHERQALFDYIGQEKITGVILVGGDVHRTRVLRHHTSGSAGYRIPELITSPVHDGVIETANAPHPALIHDSGEPNTFLLMTVDNKSKPATLDARFLNKDGREFLAVKFTEQDLGKQKKNP